MPDTFLRHFPDGSLLAVGCINELLPPATTGMDSTPSPRQREQQATQALLRQVLGDDSLVIGHEPSGMPVLPGWHISLSHTRNYVAIILSKHQEVGIDIEYVSERVNRIASRFLRTDERAVTTVERLLAWCAKETLYKLFSSQHLTYQQMRVLPYPEDTLPNPLTLHNLKTDEQVPVHFLVTAHYILTWSLY